MLGVQGLGFRLGGQALNPEPVQPCLGFPEFGEAKLIVGTVVEPFLSVWAWQPRAFMRMRNTTLLSRQKKGAHLLILNLGSPHTTVTAADPQAF